VVDESHSLGVLGNNGCVYFLLSTIKYQKKIMVASLGKGITGGVIASDQLFINQLLSNSSFISSAGMSPAFAEAMGEAAALYKKPTYKIKKQS
jgi:7-keto-8-aminopelargonate synthetase-like enzyme